VRRRLLNLLMILSLLTCGASVALWVRSRRPVVDYIAWRGQTTTLLFESGASRLWVSRWRGAAPVPIRPSRMDINWLLSGTVNPGSQSGRAIEIGYTTPPPAPSNCFGFAATHWDAMPGTTPPGSMHAVGVPWWAVVACTAAAPFVYTTRRLRRRRLQRVGLCPNCGYDLRATPGRCPECGTVARTASAVE
jgi:hypothetical protein